MSNGSDIARRFMARPEFRWAIGMLARHELDGDFRICDDADLDDDTLRRRVIVLDDDATAGVLLAQYLDEPGSCAFIAQQPDGTWTLADAGNGYSGTCLGAAVVEAITHGDIRG